MAWTTPRTWVAGELVTAALMNTYIKDNQIAIKAEADATYTFLQSRNFTDTAMLMGRGGSPIANAFGFYGSTSAPTIKLQGADPHYDFVADRSGGTDTWEMQAYDVGADSAFHIKTPDRVALKINTGGGFENRSNSTTNAIYYNHDASVEHARIGPDGISFDGGTNDLGEYEYGAPTATTYLYGGGTGYGTTTAAYVIGATSANYVRIGRLVYFHARFDDYLVPASATGSLSVGPLPFVNSVADVGPCPMMHSISIVSPRTYMVSYCSAAAVVFYGVGDGAAWYPHNITEDSGAGKYMRVTLCYLCNA